MPAPSSFTLFCVLVCAAVPTPRLSGQGQAPSPTAAFSKARALYYTPADAGLEGFRCEVNFDWKTFIQKAANQPVAEDDPRLRYLRTVQLSVDDDLSEAGELHWVAPAPAPERTEDSVSKIRSGMQQMWSGFFQSWNGFFTGGMVTLDSGSSVEHTGAGYRVVAHSNSGVAKEQYDDKLVLQSVHVGTPTVDTLVTPSFSATAQGLIVSSIRSVYKQLPSPEPTEVLMKVSYAPVNNFQIPSELTVAVGPANFDYHLANCTVRTKVTAK